MANAIQIKSRDFAIRIIGCYKFLTEQKGEYVISKQLLRCGTSIGANTRESKNAQSRMDFLNKLNIALKEAYEVMEQREQSEACFDFAESRQNSTIVKQSTGLIFFMQLIILIIHSMSLSIRTVLNLSSCLLQ